MYTTNLFDLFDEAFGLESKRTQFTSVDGQTYELALPGFSKKDLKIEVDGRILSISAEIEEKEETKWRHSFHKRFTLPNSLDADSIEAKMENGILNLTFGKSKEVKKITIL